jgi:hypothetical protein
MGPDGDLDAPPRVYEVEPTGAVEVDPEEPAFSSFRSRYPVRVLRRL